MKTPATKSGALRIAEASLKGGRGNAVRRRPRQRAQWNATLAQIPVASRKPSPAPSTGIAVLSGQNPSALRPRLAKPQKAACAHPPASRITSNPPSSSDAAPTSEPPNPPSKRQKPPASASPPPISSLACHLQRPHRHRGGQTLSSLTVGDRNSDGFSLRPPPVTWPALNLGRVRVSRLAAAGRRADAALCPLRADRPPRPRRSRKRPHRPTTANAVRLRHLEAAAIRRPRSRQASPASATRTALPTSSPCSTPNASPSPPKTKSSSQPYPRRLRLDRHPQSPRWCPITEHPQACTVFSARALATVGGGKSHPPTLRDSPLPHPC
jgi:hypothetical protein